jgi:hypothetical protein
MQIADMCASSVEKYRVSVACLKEFHDVGRHRYVTPSFLSGRLECGVGSSRGIYYPDGGSSDFRQSLYVNSTGYNLEMGHTLFLPNPVQFIIL